MSLAPDDFWYPWYPERYARKTRRLSLAADGAYRRILDALYRERQPIPDADLQAVARASDDEWAVIWPQLQPLLKRRGDGWSQKMAEEQIDAQNRKSIARKTRAAAGGRERQRRIKDLEASSKPKASSKQPSFLHKSDFSNENSDISATSKQQAKWLAEREENPIDRIENPTDTVATRATAASAPAHRNPHANAAADPLSSTRLGRMARAEQLRKNLSANIPEALEFVRSILTAGQFRQLKHEIETGKATGSIRLNDILQNLEAG